VGIDHAAEPVGYAGCNAREPRTGRSENDGCLRCAAESFACGCIGGVAGLRNGIACDGEKTCSGCGENARGFGRIRSDNTDCKGDREARGKIYSGGDGFE
jgi:hypothetical protein